MSVLKTHIGVLQISDTMLGKYSEVDSKYASSQQAIGANAKGSLSTEPMLYKDESLSLRSLLLKTAEKIDQDYWLNPEPYKLGVSLFVIKPDLVANGKKDEIFDHLRKKGFVIHINADKLLNDDNIVKIFRPDLNITDEFSRFMSSGPSTYAVVSKGYTGRSTADDLRHLIGPNEPELARENNPESLTALYGTDLILNGFYSSSSNREALKEIQIVFPEYQHPMIEGKPVAEYVHKTATLCLLGPAQARSKKGPIIQAITQRGFEVRFEKWYSFRPDEVESLYIKHRNDDFFKSLIEAYTTGPCLLLYVAKENCVADFCEFLGPFSREEFSKMPGTLRHAFDEPTTPVSTIHGSETVVDARKELQQFFPYQQTLAIIKPGLNSNQKDDILKRFNSNGFTIMTKETRRLTREILNQFYARHQGLPWFNDFIQFMSSDICEIMILAREDAVQALRELMGPVDPVRAKTDAPESIRAIYGLDIMRNGLHASSNNKHARDEIRLLFPDYEFIKNRPLPFVLTTQSINTTTTSDVDMNNGSAASGKNEVDLYHLEPHVEIIYEFTVHTRTCDDHDGKESAVFLTVIGKQSETKMFLLRFADNAITPLQSNQIDIFHFVDQDVGVPKAIKFSHDGRGFPKNWSLTCVEVTLPSRSKTFRFDINRVLIDDNVKNEYPVTEIRDVESTTNGNCAIIIQTGNGKFAGTSSDCSILLSSPQGVYAFQLRKSLTNRIPFQNRCRDVFLVDVDEQLRQLEYIVLEHNNENSAPAWFVNYVVIKLLTHEKEFFFLVDRWLSTDYLDGKIKIKLSADIKTIVTDDDLLDNRSNVVRYDISLVTGSMPDAATCYPVWITVNGTKGSIANKYLEIAENEPFPFEPDNKDLFVFYGVDIGEIDKVILGHESGRQDSGWFVKSIAIKVPSKGFESEIFKINKWLNSKRSDGVPLVEIQVRKPIVRPVKANRNAKQLQRQQIVPAPISNISMTSVHEYETSYTVYILTQDFESDMDKPSVFIDLSSDATISTGYMKLENTSESPMPMREMLASNVLAKFVARGSRIDQIKSICLLIRSPDQITRWLPSFVLVIIDDTEQFFQFENSNWLNCSEMGDFGTIENISAIATTSSTSLADQMLPEEPRHVDRPTSNVFEQLEKIKATYTNKTGQTVRILFSPNSENYPSR